MRKPLFSSVSIEPVPPELRWRIATPAELINRPLVLAGKPITLYTHRVGRRTLPCLKSLPLLRMECPHCERSRNPKCWAPVFDAETFSATMHLRIIMGAGTLDAAVKGIFPGDNIEAFRARQLKPTWCVKLADYHVPVAFNQQLIDNYIPERGDITRWLLHYWQWPEVTRGFGEVYRESIKRKQIREEGERHKFELMTGEEMSA